MSRQRKYVGAKRKDTRAKPKGVPAKPKRTKAAVPRTRRVLESDAIDAGNVIATQPRAPVGLDEGLPVLLFPVRLETRFYGSPANRLKIRIYPDPVTVDAHERGLTKDEAAAGRAFWSAIETAADESARETAWAALCVAVSVRRAAWVAQQTEAGGIGATQRAADRPERARARLLPHHWLAVAYGSGRKLFSVGSAPCRQDLPVSFDPASLIPVSDGPATDPELEWMFDFEQALEAGMAIDTAISESAREGIEELYVLGIPSATSVAPQLEKLLVAQFHARGAGFAPQGLATSNTAESDSGWQPMTADRDGLFARVFPELAPAGTARDPAVSGALTARLARTGVADNASRLRSAFGLAEDSVAGSFAFAGATEDAAMAAMNTALWPVTWGRYLNELMAGESTAFFSRADIAWVRRFFIDYVRGGASLPAIWAGASPFGTLPLTKLAALTSTDPRTTELIALLQRLRPFWNDAGDLLPVLTDPQSRGSSAGDPGKHLIEILSAVAHPATFTRRRLTDAEGGLTFIFELIQQGLANPAIGPNAAIVIPRYDYRGVPDAGDVSRAATIAQQKSEIELMKDRLSNVGSRIGYDRAALNQILVPQAPLSADDAAEFFEAVRELDSLADTGISLLEQHDARNRVFGLAGAPPELFKGPMGDGHDDPAIAYGQYSVDEETWNPDNLVTAGAAGSEIQPDVYLEYLHQRARISSGADLPAPVNPFAAQSRKPLLFHLIDAAIRCAAAASPPKEELRELSRALRDLKHLPADQLTLLLRQTLDLAGWRLDAWATALASQRLAALRETRPAGIQVGGYGWVEDLKPQVGGRERNEGYVHTPSLAHAKTAAILRSGWRARGGGPAQDPLAVDLSSARMQAAAWCFDAVRQGADLGDVLGARFERDLSGAGLSLWIDPVRRAVLTLTEENGRRSPIVDGVDLLAIWDNGAGSATLAGAMRFADGSPAAGIAEITPHLETLAGLVDALGDAALAESTHAIAQGDASLAGASLDAIVDGTAPPPALDVLATPPVGALVTTGVVLLAQPNGRPAWPSVGSPRAAADPDAERLAQALLGPPGELRFSLTWTDEAGKETPDAVSLADLIAFPGPLAAGALDLLSLLTDRTAADSPFQRWLVAASRARPDRAGRAAQQLAVDPPSDATDDDFALDRLVAWRDVLLRARALEPRDLPQPLAEGEVPAEAEKLLGPAADDVAPRAEAAAAAYETAVQTLEAAGPASEPVLREALLGLARLGHWEVLGRLDAGRDAMARAAADLLGRATARRETLDAALEEMRGSDKASVRLKAARRILVSLFGPSVPGVGRFQPAGAAALQTEFAGSASRLAVAAPAPRDWLGQVGLVRPALARLHEALLFQDALARAMPGMVVAQVPAVAGEGWCAVAAPANGEQRHSVLALLPEPAWSPGTSGPTVSGLFLDEVVDRIPATERETALAVEIESPNAEAPQALLLAVCPAGAEWSDDLLLEIVRDGLRWSRSRGVDGGVLTDFDQHLPVVFADSDLSDFAENA